MAKGILLIFSFGLVLTLAGTAQQPVATSNVKDLNITIVRKNTVFPLKGMTMEPCTTHCVNV